MGKRSHSLLGFASVHDLVQGLRGSRWSRLLRTDQDRVVDLVFRYWRRRGFPHYRFGDLEVDRIFRNLARKPVESIVAGSDIKMSMTGLGLANSFHPQMWSVRVGSARSPHERFEDDRSLRRVLRRSLAVWPDRLSVNDSNLRRMLTTYSDTARVSNFRPTAAKAIFARFSRAGDSVLDFSAGYGGRLLGCLPLERRYIGIDPCKAQIRGLRATVRKIDRHQLAKANTQIIHGCAEDVMPSLPSRSVSLVFSSPPYFDYERYSRERSQSYIRYPEYDEWKSGFLARVIRESARVLKKDGMLALNVADINGWKLTRDVLSLSESRFREEPALRLRLGRKPYLPTRGAGHFKEEPILVLKKRSRGQG